MLVEDKAEDNNQGRVLNEIIESMEKGDWDGARWTFTSTWASNNGREWAMIFKEVGKCPHGSLQSSDRKIDTRRVG